MKFRTRIGKTAAVAVVVVGAIASARGAAAQQTGAQQPSDPHQAPAAQQQSPAKEPSALAASLVTASAKVEKIDKANGLVTLKGEGKTLDVKVGPGVDIAKLKVGDTVQASFFDEVAVSIDKASAGPPKMTTKSVERAGVTAMQSTVTSRIIAVDPAKSTLSIRGPKGGEHTLKVTDPDLQTHLKQIKPGENFDVTYTQAVAVSIEPKAAPKAEPAPKTAPAPKTEPKK